MKASVDTTFLADALGDVKPAVGNQRPYVLLGVENSTLTVAADDLHVGISTMVQTEGKSAEGKVLVPHSPLAAFVAKSDSTSIDLAVKDDLLIVDDGDATCTLATVADAWFPTRPVVPDAGTTLSADDWARVRGLAQFCATDTARGVYCGIEFNDRGATAADGYTLAHIDQDFGVSRILPAQIVKAVDPDGEVTVAGDGTCTQLRTGNVVVSTSPLTGDYMDWRQHVPKPEDATARITVPAARFSRAIDRAAVLAADSPSRLGKVVKFSALESKLVIESKPDEAKGDSGRWSPR